MQLQIHNWIELKKHFPNISFTSKDLEEIFTKQFVKYNIQDVNIVFVTRPKIQKLNKEYRKKDQPTDVLTFTLETEPISGEIYICPEYIAQEYEVEKILRNIIHGFLHLLGEEHKGKFISLEQTKEDMFVKQENILDNITYEINSRAR
jgi:probable rRNA maturation factor